MRTAGFFAASVLATGLAPAAPSEETPPASAGPQAAAPVSAIPAARQDVSYRLDGARTPHAGLLELGPVSVVERGWRKFNDGLEESTGLRFGLAYTLSFQAATSGPGERSGAEGDLDLLASWRFIGGKDGADAGTFNLNAQNIHTLGGVAPAGLSDQVGAIWGTSDGIGDDESFPIVQFYYEQMLFEDRLMLVLGKIDTTNYVNTNRYADADLFFMNRAFASNPALNYPGNGLGAVLAGMLSDRWYVGGCVADANGVETESGFDSIDEGELFLAAETGLTLDLENLGEGNYRLTFWHSEDASRIELEEDFGIAVGIDQEIGGGVVPFFRAGWSDADATGMEALIAGGFGFEGVFGREDDIAGLGLSWGRAADEEYDDQGAAEAFYRLQLAPAVQCTVGGQAIFRAVDSETGETETVGVLEMRLRVAF